MNLDWTILNWIHTHLQCGLLDFLMPKISATGNPSVGRLGAAILRIGIGAVVVLLIRHLNGRISQSV